MNSSYLYTIFTAESYLSFFENIYLYKPIEYDRALVFLMNLRTLSRRRDEIAKQSII